MAINDSTTSGSGWNTFSSIASGVGQLIGGVSNAYAAYQTGKNQSEYLSYQKDLQKKIFEREDTALQRRMADAKAAGFLPRDLSNCHSSQRGSQQSLTAWRCSSSYGLTPKYIP